MPLVLLDFFPSPTEELATIRVAPVSAAAFESTQVYPCSPCFAYAGGQVSARGVLWWMCCILAQETTVLLEKCLNLDCKYSACVLPGSALLPCRMASSWNSVMELALHRRKCFCHPSLSFLNSLPDIPKNAEGWRKMCSGKSVMLNFLKSRCKMSELKALHSQLHTSVWNVKTFSCVQLEEKEEMTSCMCDLRGTSFIFRVSGLTYKAAWIPTWNWR